MAEGLCVSLSGCYLTSDTDRVISALARKQRRIRVRKSFGPYLLSSFSLTDLAETSLPSRVLSTRGSSANKRSAHTLALRKLPTIGDLGKRPPGFMISQRAAWHRWRSTHTTAGMDDQAGTRSLGIVGQSGTFFGATLEKNSETVLGAL